MNTNEIIKNLFLSAILVFVLLFLLTWSGVITCSGVPFWCNIYWNIVGEPKILIAHGIDGLGNEQKLKEVLENRDYVGARPTVRHINNLSLGNLKEYDLVIVTKAKTMSNSQIEMFYDYARQNGKLIWTGDSGTSYSQSDKKIDMEGYSNNPWIRINENSEIIELNQLLSVNYVNNFCNEVQCIGRAGVLKKYEGTKVGGRVREGLEVFGDFALIKIIQKNSTKIELSLDHYSNIITNDKENDFSNLAHLIVTSSTKGLGINVLYSSVPLENYVDIDNYYNTTMNYPSIIIDIYELMLRNV